MDKKTIIIFGLVFALGFMLSITFGGHSESFKKYEKYKYGFFPYYSSIDHKMTENEEQLAKPFIALCKEAFSFCKEGSNSDYFGGLSYFVKNNYERGIVKVYVELNLITASFSFNNGYIWAEYSEQRLDNKNEVVSLSSNVLTYWKLKKVNGEWAVVAVKEIP